MAVSAQDLSVLFRQHTSSIAMSIIHDIEKRMADLADQMKRMQVEIDAAKAAAAKTEMEHFLALELDTDGVENSNPSTSLLAPARLGHEGTGLNSSRPSGGAAVPAAEQAAPTAMDTKTEDEHGDQIAQEQRPAKKARGRGRPVTRFLPIPGSVEYTDGCPGCEGKTYYHPVACRRRAAEQASAAASSSSSGHVKGDGKGGSKTEHSTSMEQTDLQQVEDACTLLSIKDESDSRMARIQGDHRRHRLRHHQGQGLQEEGHRAGPMESCTVSRGARGSVGTQPGEDGRQRDKTNGGLAERNGPTGGTARPTEEPSIQRRQGRPRPQIYKSDVDKEGPTPGCRGCQAALVGDKPRHTEECKKRFGDIKAAGVKRLSEAEEKWKAREEAVIALDESREEVEVACTCACGTRMKWNLMDNVQVWDVDPSTIPEEELIVVDVHWHWDRFCWECRAKEWGCSVGEAQERILSKGGNSDLKRRRVQEFQDAVQSVLDFFQMSLAFQGIEMEPKEKRRCEKIARQSLLKVFPELIVVDVHWHWDRFCCECRTKQKRLIESFARQLFLKVFRNMLGVIRKRSKADDADLAEQQRLLGLLSQESDEDVQWVIIEQIDVLNCKPPGEPRDDGLVSCCRGRCVRSIVGLLSPPVPSLGGVGLAG